MTETSLILSDEPPTPAETISGTRVDAADGAPLGEIVDVAIHKPTARIAYAVLKFGGFLGLGRRYRAVPFDLLRYDVERLRFVARLTREEVVIGPDLDPASLKRWSDARLRRQLYAYYGALGAEPYWR